MGIDASIALGVKPVQIEDSSNALAKLLQVQGAQQANQLNTLKMDEYRQGVSRKNSLNSLLGQNYATPDAREEALLKGGFAEEALKFGKDRRDNAKSDAETQAKSLETAHKRLEVVGQGLGWLKDNPSPENAQSLISHWVQTGVMSTADAQQKMAQFQADPSPQSIQRLALMGYQGALSAKDQLPKFETRNTGGTTDTLAIDPVTGKARVANSVQNTQSPDNAATVAQSERNSLRVDARSRETTAATISKPFEITGEDGKPVLVQQDKQGNIRPVQGYTPKQGASKPLTDTQAKALQFGSRMQAAEDIFDQLAGKGVTTSIPGSRAGYGVGAIINAVQPAERQQLDQAKRDFINAVLRRESGAAISPSEFESAEKQYFPQPGETDPKTLAQKKNARQLSMRGILAEVPDSDNRVAKVRASAAPAAAGPNIDALLDKYK